MHEFSTYEFVVRQKIEGKWRAARAGLIALYILFPLTVLLLGMKASVIAPLLALIPISLWILIFMTWRFVSVEYEYSITSGILTFAKVYGGRSRRKILEISLHDAVRIAPLDNEDEAARANQWIPEREYSGISSPRAPDIYFILFEDKASPKQEKRRAIFYFEATERALQICRFYNPSGTVMTHPSR